jgi:hypothetical protein
MSVDDFAVIGIEDYAGLDTPIGHHLTEHGFDSGPAIVAVACPTDQYSPTDEYVPNAALGVEVSKPTDARAGGRDLEITFETESGRRGTLTWPLELLLCGVDEGEAFEQFAGFACFCGGPQAGRRLELRSARRAPGC